MAPCIQRKPCLGAPRGAAHERHADDVAERVMQMPDAEFATSTAPIQRQCAACADDARQTLQMRRVPSADTAAPRDVRTAVETSARAGAPLSHELRSFFEPRFGYDFSNVRVHADGEAARAARGIGARAYTLGRDIVLGAGEYRASSDATRRLLAHELTHVVQQSHGEPAIQRMTLGSGTGPQNEEGITLVEPPPGDRARINAVIARLARVAEHPDAFAKCHAYYRDNCPGHKPDALQDAFKKAVLWKLPKEADDRGAGAAAAVGESPMYYTQHGYSAGEETLAGYIMHELTHICGVGGGSEHKLADIARLYCMGAGENELDVRIAVGTDRHVGALIGYRRLLTSWSSGRQRLRAGLDVDIIGLMRQVGDRTTPTELASGTVGLQRRVNPWGGERWGGLTLSTDVGLGVDRFRVRDVRPDDPPQAKVGPGFVVQLGARAEFYFPDLQGREGRRFGVTLDAAYRLVQPLTPDAKQIHEVVVGVGVPF